MVFGLLGGGERRELGNRFGVNGRISGGMNHQAGGEQGWEAKSRSSTRALGRVNLGRLQGYGGKLGIGSRSPSRVGRKMNGGDSKNGHREGVLLRRSGFGDNSGENNKKRE